MIHPNTLDRGDSHARHMRCPLDDQPLATRTYEGVQIDTCDACGGSFLDQDELGKVVRIREVRFSEAEKQAIAAATPIVGVPQADVDRRPHCPRCGCPTTPINYGSDSGIIVDRCDGCGGFWLDGSELEKVQMVVEGWDDRLPEVMAQHRATLHEVERGVQESTRADVSRLPLVGRFINAMVNGVLNLTGR